MAITPSNMLPLGTSLPAFSLPDVTTGATVSHNDFKGRSALLVIFLCKHCPYVIHVRNELARIGRDYGPRNVGVIGISSNDVENYPDDSPANLMKMAAECGFTFPVCYDETQEVAEAFHAACTPDFFLFDGAMTLVYRGQLDGTRPGGPEPDGRDLRAALDALLGGQIVTPNQKPSTGCNIKWRHSGA